MPNFHRAPPRVVLGGAIAVATLIAPAAAAFAGPIGYPAPRAVAQTECSGGESVDAYSLACVPDVAPGIGAPSEMQLTDTNPGIASPSHGGR
jgi:hypothetical protein